MTTYPTLEAARQAAEKDPTLYRSVIEAEMESGERVFLIAKVDLAGLRAAIAKSGKGLPGVWTLVAEHAAMTAERSEELRREALREHCHCDRCGVKVDGNVAYSQNEWGTLAGRRAQVVAYYCTSCEALLQAIGMGERSAMEERASVAPAAEPYTKRD